MPSPELYKDKVEVSLDGRQIFYLFFGGAVIVGIVFVLGVLVGRRVEARGHVDKARTTAATDPLAALDRLEGSGGMAFRGALTGKEEPAPVEKAIDDIEKSRAKKDGKGEEKKAETKSEEKKTETKSEEKKSEQPVTKPSDASAKSDGKNGDAKSGDAKKTDGKSSDVAKSDAAKVDAKKSDAKPDSAKSDSAKSDSAKSDSAKTDSAKKSDAAKTDSAKSDTAKSDEPKKEQRYTLQLSSFQDRAEAEAFLSNVKSQGYTAQITQAEVEGKGTFYRVRMGTYKSLDAATSAKSDFEKSSSKSASIMKL